ncbi:hypothetical protein NKJ10_25810 [Mesorhizobium sp. M0204]|uniref:hypothetical protein n=1 Tax=Mesorhizobium sp. M0204 TaxID=2956913 RepID=UPI003335BC61
MFNKVLAALAAKGGKPDQLMIDAIHLHAHRTAAGLLKKGLFPDVSDATKGPEGLIGRRLVPRCPRNGNSFEADPLPELEAPCAQAAVG